MLQLINLFLEQDFEIVFASAAQESDFSFDLESLHIKKEKIELNSSSFDSFISDLNPDLVLFDRFVTEEQFGWRVAESCPNATRILDTEDLHCLRLARQMAIKKNTDFQLEDLLNEEVSKREIASIYRCDLSLIISDFEMGILQNVFKIDAQLLHYLPMFYNADDNYLTFEEKQHFVFIGNFLHEPNWDAVKQLKEHIWSPIKKQLPEAELYIFGAYPSQKVLQFHNEKEGFIIKGRAEDALEVIKSAKIMLAPLRFGAGVKGKLLEAMKVGTPSVTTFIGAEGISNAENWNGFVTNEIEDFIEKTIALYQNQQLWKEKQQKGTAILSGKFSKQKYAPAFFEKILSLNQTIYIHRRSNFIGNLLQQQSFSSTKFMSKWIEEKNKKKS
ncbi:glycosyltransferase [Flavobacterium amnicola]|uniref:Glycosyltransferase n=2 Tax=Flavobacterium amnicola TaxID=2506422 RepID=A0A4V1N216_9FLAO|nr:glycosyltransferase [Flavobacterium amnicola]